VPDVRGGWNGASYDDAVTQWGTPVRTSKLSDGRNAYTWRSEALDRTIGAYPSTGVGMGSGPAPVGTDAIMGGTRSVCQRTLIFEDGRVVDQNWEGSPEYCSRFARGAAPKP
jgi:hypothetical protein